MTNAHTGTNGQARVADNEFWDQEKLVGEVTKNARGEMIRVKYVTKRGRAYVDVRTFYRDDQGNLRPSRGISIPENVVPSVIRLLQSACQYLSAEARAGLNGEPAAVAASETAGAAGGQ